MKYSISSRKYLLIILTLVLISLANGNQLTIKIDQSKGIDQRINYNSLVDFGPWDDRNYKITLDDLSFLSPIEKTFKDPIPAFFRIELRKTIPSLYQNNLKPYLIL